MLGLKSGECPEPVRDIIRGRVSAGAPTPHHAFVALDQNSLGSVGNHFPGYTAAYARKAAEAVSHGCASWVSMRCIWPGASPAVARIASPEMLPEADPLPHVTCSRAACLGMGRWDGSVWQHEMSWSVALVARYAGSNRKERGRTLDEFVAVSGVHRKHAMRLLRAGQAHHRSGPRPARRLYNQGGDSKPWK